MKNAKSIAVLGSTGSIGRQTLEVMSHLGLAPAALTAGSNVKKLEEQIRAYHPAYAAMNDEKAAADLRTRVADLPVKVLSGPEGIVAAAVLPITDTVVTAVVGIAGLRPTMAAIEAGKTIALANKETLVCAGRLVMAKAKAYGVKLIPVDSEHSAIFQCLECVRGREEKEVSRVILTASGGPFFKKTVNELSTITPGDALKHPNWNMGAKITIDSATLMNKGLEFIEAMHLYGLKPEQIDVVVQRESVIHSMVEFIDHSIMAQMGVPDMRLPIQYALTWPERLSALTPSLDFEALKTLNFDLPDERTFRCLALAKAAAGMPSSAAVAMNGANEAAVALFLAGRIGFLDIAEACERVMGVACVKECANIDEVYEYDRAARDKVYKDYGEKAARRHTTEGCTVL